MADINNTITNTIVVNTSDAEAKLKTLRQQLQELRNAKDAAFQTKDNSAFASIGTAEKAKYRELQQFEATLTKQQDARIKSEAVALQAKQKDFRSFLTEQDSANRKQELSQTRQYEKYQQQMSNLKGQQNAQSSKQMYIDEGTQGKSFSKQMQQQMQLPTPLSAPQNYAQGISTARAEAERLHQVMQQVGTTQSKLDFANARTGLHDAVRASDAFNVSIEKSTGIWDGFGRRVKSHLEWLVSGATIMGAIAVPAMFAKTIADVDLAMASMKQVMPELHINQQAFNQEALKFIDIAATYGQKIEDIIKAGTLWGRMYGRVADGINIVNTLTQQSAIITVADNMSLVEANKNLEAAMFQYGLVAKNSTEALAYSGRIIDVWTKLAHTGGVSATDLAEGVARSGAVAKQTGVDFEFLNAMIATTVRATGRGGAEIGNMIKSVLGSIHSEKATKEIEALGIATKQVGANGEVELRKAQDVLLDIAVTAGSTSKNLEDLFKGIAGGKWQWSKAAAMLGDYKTFIQTWGEAVNSTGFSAEQVGMQLDTLSRRMAKLKADVEGMAVSSGNNGLSQWMKEQLTAMDNFIMGLRNIPKDAYTAAIGLGQLAIAVNLCKWALAQYAIAASAANAATTALARRNVIILGFVALSTAIAWCVEQYGELANAERTAGQVAEDKVAIEEQQIQQMKKQAEFVDTLFLARAKLDVQSKDASTTDEKRIEQIKNVGVTEKELGKILGDEAMERIRSNNFSIESIETEVGAFKKGISDKQDALIIMRLSMAQNLDNTIEWLQLCIKNYYIEADAFGDSIGRKINALGIWRAAMLTAQEWDTKVYELERDAAKAIVDKSTPESSGRKIFEDIYDSAQVKVEASQAAGKAILADGLKPLQDELKAAQGERLKLGMGGLDFNPPGAGGNKKEDEEKKVRDKTSGLIPPSDPLRKIERDQYKDAVTRALHDAKLATDRYAESVDVLTTKEEIEGKTTALAVERLDLMKKRRQELNDQEWVATTNAEDLLAKRDEMIGDSAGILADFGVPSRELWIAMNKESRAGLLIEKADIVENYKDIKAITAAYYAWSEDASKAHKEGTKLDNERTKAISALKPEELYRTQLDRNKVNEDLELSKTTNKSDPNNEIALDKIRKIWLLKNKEDYDAELKRLDGIVAVDKIALENELDAGRKEIIAKRLVDEQDAANKQRLIIQNNANAQIDLEYQKNAKIKDGLEGMVSDVLLQGKSLKDVWGSLWKALASDALKQLMGVRNGSQSLLGSILGLFGGSKGGLGGSKYDGITPNAEGSIGSKEELSWIREGGKREAIIPIEGDHSRAMALWKQTGVELGAFSGTNVTADVSPRTMEIAQQGTIESQVSREHIAELQKSNSIMSQQLQVMQYMASNQGEGGTTTLQPIIMQQSLDMDSLAATLGKMKSRGYNFG
jgi:TP901 family phage tail tape measure protein